MGKIAIVVKGQPSPQKESFSTGDMRERVRAARRREKVNPKTATATATHCGVEVLSFSCRFDGSSPPPPKKN